MSYQQNDDQEPPSYDHAVQTSLEPHNVVHTLGRFNDASYDSYERGEMFIQAFRSQLDTFAPALAQEVAQYGLANVLRIDLATHQNDLFRHPRAIPNAPAVWQRQDGMIEFWPSYRALPAVEDGDVTIQATHPYLTFREYDVNAKRECTQHYFEVKVHAMAQEVVLAIGLTTRPYPLFRMPGWNKFSVAYHSDDGRKFCDDPTGGQEYGPSWGVGDIVGCGYQPETGNIFFTLNGRMIDQAFVGLERHHYFASFGADGFAQVSINFGQRPFLFQLQDWAGDIIQPRI